MKRAALLAALALAACSEDAPQACPGQAVFEGVFAGTLVNTALPGDPDPRLPQCDALPFPPSLAPFAATLAEDEGTAAALCRGGQVLFGTRTAEGHWEVGASSGGAVLDRCGSTCVATSTVSIVGDLLPDPVNPTSFDGALVEQLAAETEGTCGACLPCAARYELAGAGAKP